MTTHYDFSFKVNVKLIAGSWIKFTFPNDDYVISSSPHCYSVMVDRVMVQGNLTCTGNGREVSLTGISADIEPGTDVLIRVQVTNPNRVKTTGTFTIDTRRQGTNTIFEKRESIPGVNIIAGLMTKVSLTPVDTSEMLALDKVVYYNLRFTLYNDIPQGGSLSVIFNENINPELAGAPTLY